MKIKTTVSAGNNQMIVVGDPAFDLANIHSQRSGESMTIRTAVKAGPRLKPGKGLDVGTANLLQRADPEARDTMTVKTKVHSGFIDVIPLSFSPPGSDLGAGTNTTP